MTGPERAPVAHETTIERGLSPAEIAAIRAHRTRRSLEGSTLYRGRRDAIEDLTFALELRRAKEPAPRPDRRFLRAVTWNIERGSRLDRQIAFLLETAPIRAADVILLNEVDIGMARSQNRNVAREIAEALGFDYAFGNSYLCLGHGDVRDGEPSGENELGLHGNAILSRYPILRAENVSVTVTRDKFVSAERRLGHKKALWAEIDAPQGRLPVAAAHLDPYASPAQRAAQMRDLLEAIERRDLGPRVLLGGDLNTSTYDLESLPRLARNVAAKLWRGGFPHAIEHYMRPHELYERALFDELGARGFTFEGYNDMTAGTARYETGTFDSESKVREHLPSIFVHVLRYKLKPWNGVAQLKVDWFLGRGLRPLRAGEMTDPDGRASLSPTVFERARYRGEQLSDHDPILVDVAY